MAALAELRMATGSMSTQPSEAVLDTALAGVEKTIRARLIHSYLSVRVAFADGNFDNVGQRAGFFAECVLRALQHSLTGNYTPFGKRLPNVHDECVRLQASPATAGPESLRILLPRAIDFMYTLRNKRGIGHVGGDVDANQIDAATCRRLCDWCVCELIRIYHLLSLEEAQALLDALATRELPQVWRVGDQRRVVVTDLDYKSQVLLLLYGEDNGMAPAEDLCSWTEHPRLSDFRTRVLKPLHIQRLVEYDRETEVVILSPKGIATVEKGMLGRLQSRGSAV